jgi:hypothetical protein
MGNPTAFEWLVIILGAVGALLWLRGAWRGSVGDGVLGLLLAMLAQGVYFVAFRYTGSIGYLGALICGLYAVLLLPLVGRQRRWAGKALLLACLALGLGSAAWEHRLVSAGNALLTIEPYRTGNGWAFDEPRLGLRREPFVAGVPEIIDRLVAGVPGSDTQVRLIFSQTPFPGHQLQLDRGRPENGGYWYSAPAYSAEGWLCPALFKYFPRAPRHLYVKAERI